MPVRAEQVAKATQRDIFLSQCIYYCTLNVQSGWSSEVDDAFLPIWNYRIETTETGYLLLGIYTGGDSREVTTVSTGGITQRSSWNSTHDGNY